MHGLLVIPKGVFEGASALLISLVILLDASLVHRGLVIGG